MAEFIFQIIIVAFFQAINSSSRISGMLKELILFEVLGLSSGDVNDSSFFIPSNLSERGLFTIIETGLKPDVFLLLVAVTDEIF